MLVTPSYARSVGTSWVGTFTIVAIFGNTRGVAGVIFVAIIVLIGWRGVRATWLYHIRSGLRTSWKRVLAISSLAAFVSILTFGGLALAAVLMALDIENDDVMGTLVMGTVVGRSSW